MIGTALLVFVGAGSVPAILLLEGGTKAPFSGADLGFISMAFGLIVVAMVYTVGKISGCHINPAVTFALAVTKKFPWREVPMYWGSQLVGGIAGGMAMWAAFGGRAIDLGYGFGVVNFDHSVTSWGSAMFAEALGTAILLFTIMGIVDSRSPAGWAGLVISGDCCDHHRRGPDHERIAEPGEGDRHALHRRRRRWRPQLDEAALRVHPGQPVRGDVRGRGLRLDREAAHGRAADRDRRRARARGSQLAVV